MVIVESLIGAEALANMPVPAYGGTLKYSNTILSKKFILIDKSKTHHEKEAIIILNNALAISLPEYLGNAG